MTRSRLGRRRLRKEDGCSVMVWGMDGRTVGCLSKRVGRPTGLAGGRQASGGSRLFRSASCWGRSGQGPQLRPRSSHRGLQPCPRSLSTARTEEEEEVVGRGSAHSYLHPANVNGQDSGEKQHLKEEVRYQPHNSKKTELLEKRKCEDCDLRAQHWRTSSLPAVATAPCGSLWTTAMGPDHCTPNSRHPGCCRAVSCQAGTAGRRDAGTLTSGSRQGGCSSSSLPPHEGAAETPRTEPQQPAVPQKPSLRPRPCSCGRDQHLWRAQTWPGLGALRNFLFLANDYAGPMKGEEEHRGKLILPRN